MPKSKVSAFFSVLLVFVSGAAMGAVGYRLYAVKSGSVPSVANAQPAPPKKSPEDVRKIIVADLKDKVKLDDNQTQQVEKIYEDQFSAWSEIHNHYQSVIDQANVDSHHKGEQLHEAAVAKINALLSPDQQQLYAQWQADRAAAQAKRKQQRDREKHDHPDGRQRPLPPMPPLP